MNIIRRLNATPLPELANKPDTQAKCLSVQ